MDREPIVILTRVSTDKQAQGSDSPQVQEDYIRQWASVSNRDVVSVYGRQDEGASGTIPALERPDTAAAIAHAIQLRCALVVYSLDRFGRDGLDLVETGNMLVDKGANLIALADGLNLRVLRTSAVGKLLYWIQAGLAQFVRDQIAEKTSAALQNRKKNGQCTGKAPYGYSVDRGRPETRIRGNKTETYYPHLIEVSEEQELIAMIHRMADSGERINYTWIAEELNRGGLRRRGGEWYANDVRRILLKRL